MLGDLCGGAVTADHQALSAERKKIVQRRTVLKLPEGCSIRDRLGDAVVNLGFSHRFDITSSLGRLANSIRDGNTDAAIQELHDADPRQITWIQLDQNATEPTELVETAMQYYSVYLQQLALDWSGSIDVLHTLSGFRILWRIAKEGMAKSKSIS